MVSKSHCENRAEIRIVRIFHQKRYHKEIVVVVNVKQMSVGNLILHKVHCEMLLSCEFHKELFILLVARDVIADLQEGEHLQGVRALFVDPFVVVVEQVGIPVCPRCRKTVCVNKAEIMVDNMIEYLIHNVGNERLFLIVGNKIVIVCIAVEVTDHLVRGGLAEPFTFLAVLVLGEVPFVTGARAVISCVGISDRSCGKALDPRYPCKSDHRKK